MSATTALARIKDQDQEPAAADEIRDAVADYVGAVGLQIDVVEDEVNSTASTAVFTVTLTDPTA